MSYGLVTNNGWIGDGLNGLAVCIGTSIYLLDVCPKQASIRVIGWPCIKLLTDHFADADSCDPGAGG
jgi:hypothetical protein